MPSLIDSLLAYFEIPVGFGPIDGLRWSASGETIEVADGNTFLFAVQLQPYYDGFLRVRPLMHFGLILDTLHLLGVSQSPIVGMPTYQVDRVRRIFRQSGSSFQNAGVFFGSICNQSIPVSQVGLPSRPGALLDLISKLPAFLKLRARESYRLTPDSPPIEPGRFRAFLGEQLIQFSDAQLSHWFRFGSAPVYEETSERIADQLQTSDRMPFTAVLETILKEANRLSETRLFIPQFESILTLPRRKDFSDEPPQGGYTDTTNRGRPENLLPSQFALPEDEFIRRFAQNELLFFDREQPEQRESEDLILVLDQGVRTWGEIRQALVAAAIVYTRIALKRERPVKLWFTSHPILIDPHQSTQEELAKLLEQSTLDRHPGDGLHRLIDQLDERPCDVVVLTHPRAMQEPSMRFELNRAPKNARVFALTLNDLGEGAFGEWSHGLSRSPKTFRVTLQLPQSEKPTIPQGAWKGPVEPIPFPFRFGLHGAIQHIALESLGQYVAVWTASGMLFAWNIQTGMGGPLPKPCHATKIVHAIQLVGVRGGFLLLGHDQHQVSLAHYDLNSRVMKLYDLEFEFKKHNVANARVRVSNAEHVAFVELTESYYAVIDLHTGEMIKQLLLSLSPNPAHRLDQLVREHHEAESAYDHRHSIPYVLKKIPEIGNAAVMQGNPMGYWFAPKSGALWLAIGLRVDSLQDRFLTPQADGAPLLKDRVLDLVLFAGNTVVCFLDHLRAYFLNPVRKTVIGEIPVGRKIFSLSEDGKFFASEFDTHQVRVHQIEDNVQLKLTLPVGGAHCNLEFCWFDELYIQIGSQLHVISWRKGPLQHQIRVGSLPDHHDVDRPSRSVPDYFRELDAKRFTRHLHVGVDLIVDIYGQFIFWDSIHEELLGMLWIWRKQLAVWLPDGTCYGPAELIEGVSDNTVLDRFAARLRGHRR
jgi:hypothetical protein